MFYSHAFPLTAGVRREAYYLLSCYVLLWNFCRFVILWKLNATESLIVSFHKSDKFREDLITPHLVNVYCKPHLLYTTECLALTITQMHNLRKTWSLRVVSDVFVCDSIYANRAYAIAILSVCPSVTWVIHTKRMKLGSYSSLILVVLRDKLHPELTEGIKVLP